MELIDVIDDDNKTISTVSRRDVRKSAFLHKAVVVFVISRNGHFLVQKRSKNKDIFPGCWELGCAETVQSGEDHIDAAKKRLYEELGINVSKIELTHSFQFDHRFRFPNHNVNYKLYKWFSNNFIKLQEEEVDEAKFLTLNEVDELIKTQPFYLPSAEIFYLYLKKKDLDKHIKGKAYTNMN